MMVSQTFNDKVMVVHYLSEEALRHLFENKICVLHVRQFCEQAHCDKLSRWFINHEALTEYNYVMKREDSVKSIYYGVDRVGVPYNSTYGDDHQKGIYYRSALPGIRALREASHPFLSPVDKLRLLLDECWPQGAKVANFEGKKMFIGIGRIMRSPLSRLSEYQPHWDSVPMQYVNLLEQFSANMYLSTPKSGGELEIWDVDPIPTSVIHANDPDRDWRAELPPSIIVKPEQGDLFLFNTRRPHAIRGFDHGVRVAAQFFIGINQDKSLSMWT